MVHADTGQEQVAVMAYQPGFIGGVRVANDDFTQDGIPDLVTVNGPGMKAWYKGFDGVTGTELFAFQGFGDQHTKGAFVAIGDVNGDGRPDLIGALGKGGNNRVKVWSGADFSLINSFFVYGEQFSGGVRLAVGDLDGNGRREVLVAPGPGRAPLVKAFDPVSGQEVWHFLAAEQSFEGGLFIGANDVSGDGIDDVIVGMGKGGDPLVSVWGGAERAELFTLQAHPDAGYSSGVRVASAFVNGDAHADLVTSFGPGDPHVRIFDGQTRQLLDGPTASFQPFGPDALTGTWVAAANDPPTVQFAAATYSVAENGTPQVTVTLSAAHTLMVTVNVSVTGGTGAAGTDYTMSPHQLLFMPGQTSKNVLITAVNDATDEPDKTVVITLSGPMNATLGSPASATLTITDINTVEGNGGTSTWNFTVNLDNPSEKEVTVEYQTQDGTATVIDGDYVPILPPPPHTVTFTPGATTRFIPVEVVGDTKYELDEYFYVNLSNAVNASIPDPQAQATIPNDDTNPGTTPTVAIDDVAKQEGDVGTTPFTFKVGLSHATNGTVTVGWSPSAGTATPGIDYTVPTPPAIVTFNPGETTKTLTIDVVGDLRFEPDETFFIDLTSATNATISDNQGKGTIVNDDGDVPLAPHAGPCGPTLSAYRPPPRLGGLATLNTGSLSALESGGPIRYFDGAVQLATTDLGSDGFGVPWSHTRNWSNAEGYSAGQYFGSGWQVSEIPHLIKPTDDRIIVIFNAMDALFFDKVNDVWVPHFFHHHTLTEDSGEYVLADEGGNRIRFNSLSGSLPAAQRGLFKSFTDPYGHVTQVTSWTTDGKPAEVQRSDTTGGTTVTESYLYAYVACGVNASLLESVTLRRQSQRRCLEYRAARSSTPITTACRRPPTAWPAT